MEERLDETQDAAQGDRRGAALSRSSDEQALTLDSGRFEALNNLGVTLQKRGEFDAAEARYREALRLRPCDVQGRFNLAVLLAARGLGDEALDLTRELIAEAPSFVPAYLLTAALEAEFERFAMALEQNAKALALAPANPLVLVRHADILLRSGEPAPALAICEDILSRYSGYAQALHLRALALQGLDRCDEALTAFDLATASTPAPALASKAWLLAELGRKPEALACLDRAVTLDPANAKAWYEKASLIKVMAGDPALLAMERLAQAPTTPRADRIQLCFALGRSYLDQKEGERAFVWLDRGNRGKRAMIRYDAEAETASIKDLARVYSREVLAGSNEPGALTDPPVFVIGMPRSGTTLLEHILASHPDVTGLGEPPALSRIAESLKGRLPSPDEAAACGKTYLEFCTGAAQGRRRAIDKTPSNFRHAGLISLILPGAKIIHCRRDPFDTCLSCYSLLFARGHPFTYDLAELGASYRLYLGLMAHWRRVLPAGRMLEIDYESLVSDEGTTTRRVLDFCGLPFHDACLRPHETARRVTSASLAQVRSPVYQTSAGRARRFMPWLEALGDFIPPRFA